MRGTIGRTLLAVGSGTVLFGASPTSAQRNSRQNEEAAVMAQEKAWSDAFIEHDLKRLGAILSDDFVGIDGRGVVSNKSDELKEAEAAPDATAPKLLRENYTDMSVRLYGRTAILNDVNNATFLVKGAEKLIRYRRTTVWVKTNGMWRCVSFHASRLPDKAN